VSFAVALGDVFLQWAIVERLAASLFQPSRIFNVLSALQEFLVIFDRLDASALSFPLTEL
jgi:hypothetical protein